VDTFSGNGIRVLDVDNDVLLHSTMIHGRKS
jgi:hypothetical protein